MAKGSTASYGAVVLLVLLAATAGTAAAQLPVANPGIAITLPAEPLSLAASNNTTLAGTVSNTGPLAGQVDVALGVPAGWAVTVEPAQFTLASGATQDIVLTITAPAASEGQSGEPLVATATITEQSGRSATSEASVTLTRIDPPPPPPNPWPLRLAIGGVVLALLVALGVVLAVRRRNRRRAEAEAARLAAEARAAAEREAYMARETGITIHALDGPHPFGAKREMTARVEVKNASARTRVALVGVKEIPAGWHAAVSIPRIPLSAGEAATVTVYIRPDDQVPPGEVGRIVVFAKPDEARDLDERAVLDVPAPAVRVPKPGEVIDPVVAHREAIAPRPQLRP